MKCIAAIVCLILVVVGASRAEETEHGQSVAAPDHAVERSDEGDSRRAERLRAMQGIAESLTVEIVGTEGNTKVELVEGARFRFATPEIGCFDGSAWLWGRGQRPLALLTISAYRFQKDGPCQWSYELTSLAPSELRATSSEGRQGGAAARPSPRSECPP